MLCECHLFSEREKIRRKREKKGRRQRGKEGVGGKKLFAQRFIARMSSWGFPETGWDTPSVSQWAHIWGRIGQSLLNDHFTPIGSSNCQHHPLSW
jgi:hypothetical protein